MRGFRPRLIGGAVALACLGSGTPAGAATVEVERAVERDCSQRAQPGAPGVATRKASSPGVAMVSARLSGARGDWQLAVFDAADRLIVASAYPGGDQVAQGFATEAGELVVQACRTSGAGTGAALDVDVTELTEPAQRMQIVRVAVPDETAEAALVGSGLDLTEHGGDGFVDVVLHSPDEAGLLDQLGLDHQVVDPDLLESTLTARRAELRAARRGASGGLPSGRTGPYRTPAEYSQEMQALADRSPRLVRYFTLAHKTYEGRPVEAIEIAPRVRRSDGRPVFLMMGAHHAREWPSSEHTMEFAYELVNGWKQKRPAIARLMRRTRVILVPVVNPDGFNASRMAATALLSPDGRGGIDETANLLLPYEYHRKNCRTHPPQPEPGGSCTQLIAPTGLAQFGVDPNRNYGGFWGGPGASAADSVPFGALAQDYRGPGPFSEPETRNIRRLVSTRQVTTLITNHTFSNLVLRPPGLQAQGPPPDERLYKRLGDAMARENGYTSQRSYQLYDTTGSTEDWSYYATGGLGFTFEIGPDHFHPPFADGVIAEYRGATGAAGAGGGNRAAYLKALRSTANAKRHSVIGGSAPRGTFLTLRKTFRTPTSPVIDGAGEEGDVIRFRDRLKTTLRVDRSGRFRWHVNPSTRPLVASDGRKAKRPRGEPSPPVTFQGDATSALPCADADAEDPACFNDHTFRVPGGDGVDNGTATVRITWATPASDWDMKVFRDTDGDGSSVGESNVLGSSASGPTNVEETTIASPGLRPGRYVVRVTNFAGLEPYDGRVTFGKTPRSQVPTGAERWKLACRARPGGPVLAKRRILVERGERARVDLRRACRR